MANFCTFLHAIRREDLTDILKLFKEKYTKMKENGWTALHWAAWYNDSSEICHFLIEKGSDIEAQTNCHLGFAQRPIHMAAQRNHVDTLKILISKGCCLEAKNKMGETALEVSMKKRNIDCAVIIRGAMISNTQVIQPSEVWKSLKNIAVSIVEKVPSIQEDLELIRNNNLAKVLDVEGRRTILDILVEKSNPKIIEAIKSKPIDDQEVKEWLSLNKKWFSKRSIELLQECLLYRCICHNNQLGFITLCTAEIVNRTSLFRGPTALEIATEYKRVLCLKVILQKLIRCDDSWSRAKDIAKRRDIPIILELLSERTNYLNHRAKKGYGGLHVAVFDNEPEVLEYILRNGLLESDHGHKNVGSALNLAYEMDSINCIRVLQKYKINANTVDRWNQTPLHIAIKKRVEEHCDYLVDNVENLEQVDKVGLTLLQRAVLNNCEKISDRLVKRGASVGQYLNMVPDEAHIRFLDAGIDQRLSMSKSLVLRLTEQETIHSLCIKVNQTIYPYMLRTIDFATADLRDANQNTLLHLAAVSLLPDICSKLLLVKDNINSLNENGKSPLIEVLEQVHGQILYKIEVPLIKTVKVLVDAGAGLGITDSDGRDVMQIVTDFYSEELLLVLIRSKESVQRIKKPLWEMWIRKKYFRAVKEAIRILNPLLLTEWISSAVIVDVLIDGEISLIKVLFNKADQKVKTEVIEAFLYRVACDGDMRLFGELITHPQSPISSLCEGESLLGCLIKENKMELCGVVLNSRHAGVFLDKKNARNKLPIHLCIEHESWGIIEQVLKKSSFFDGKDDDGNTPLALLLTRLSHSKKITEKEQLIRYAKMLITRSADINKKDRKGTPAIMKCSDERTRAELQQLCRQKSVAGTVEAVDVYDEPNDQYGKSKICSKCGINRRDCVLNCGHRFCMECSMASDQCFQCRQRITDRREL